MGRRNGSGEQLSLLQALWYQPNPQFGHGPWFSLPASRCRSRAFGEQNVLPGQPSDLARSVWDELSAHRSCRYLYSRPDLPVQTSCSSTLSHYVEHTELWVRPGTGED